jgi:hypothetical protein
LGTGAETAAKQNGPSKNAQLLYTRLEEAGWTEYWGTLQSPNKKLHVNMKTSWHGSWEFFRSEMQARLKGFTASHDEAEVSDTRQLLEVLESLIEEHAVASAPSEGD